MVWDLGGNLWHGILCTNGPIKGKKDTAGRNADYVCQQISDGIHCFNLLIQIETNRSLDCWPSL
jgi:hypothetical protein